MNLPLSVSVSLQFLAFFWSIRLAKRERDWRISVLAAAMGFIAIRRLLVVKTGSPFIFGSGVFAELPGLILGGVTLAAIVALDRTMSERRRVEQELKKSHQQLRELAARLDNVREEERASVSREIHDEIGQVLTGLKIEAKLFSKEIQSTHPHLFVRAQEMMMLIDRSMLKMRDIATELRPSILDTLGLLAAIEWQAESFEEQTGIRCKLNSNIGDEKFDGDLETAVFRIFQESLTNVLRHSEATEVEIEFDRKDKKLALIVRDNGKGISTDDLNKPHSLGILGMHERALNFHGIISVAGKPKTGTIVSLSLPLTPDA
ncbi:MAG: sensor histidine kinase [Acidobacteriota bacterium]|nr:sensor histidine kinase [Acidobacteriota bacterium]